MQSLDHNHRDRLAALGILAASIAHEFNNILTPVLSYAQLAQRHPDDPELTRRALDRAAAGTERAHRIAAQILRLAQPPTPADTGARADVAQAIKATLGLFEENLSRHHVGVDLEVSGAVAARIDPVCLEQVLLNLVNNSAKAMAARGGRLCIRAKCSTRNTAHAVIEVADSGPGMPAAVLARVFEPFASRLASDQSQGSGLGLSICKRLIEASGGEMTAESAPGRGTTVRVTLPLAA